MASSAHLVKTAADFLELPVRDREAALVHCHNRPRSYRDEQRLIFCLVRTMFDLDWIGRGEAFFALKEGLLRQLDVPTLFRVVSRQPANERARASWLPAVLDRHLAYQGYQKGLLVRSTYIAKGASSPGLEVHTPNITWAQDVFRHSEKLWEGDPVAFKPKEGTCIGRYRDKEIWVTTFKRLMGPDPMRPRP